MDNAMPPRDPNDDEDEDEDAEPEDDLEPAVIREPDESSADRLQARFGADARPHWGEQPSRESLTGVQWR
jgi:hypothetical protein